MALKSNQIGSHYQSLQLTFLRLFGANAIVRLMQIYCRNKIQSYNSSIQKKTYKPLRK